MGTEKRVSGRRSSRRQMVAGGLAAAGALAAVTVSGSVEGPAATRMAHAQNPSRAVLRVTEIGRAITQGLVTVEFAIVGSPTGFADGVAVLDPALPHTEFNRQLARAGVRALEVFGTVIPAENVLVLGGASATE